MGTISIIKPFMGARSRRTSSAPIPQEVVVFATGEDSIDAQINYRQNNEVKKLEEMINSLEKQSKAQDDILHQMRERLKNRDTDTDARLDELEAIVARIEAQKTRNKRTS